MSYLVLARKWRPQGFDDLVGQEPITRILKNSLSQNKIAHAYIFSGPRGVGKTSTARILAKALNCEKGPTPSPCGVCASCIAIKDGSSIDVLEIDGASNNSVDDIRDLREGVKYTPLGGRYKIYIIDEAHMLSTSAFNALLKTLEEPPPHAIFVLATTAAKKIPATIFSRCQHLPFRRISAQKIKERLKHIKDSEAIKISDSAIEMVARAADGSMRDSLTILDQVTSFSSEITDTEVKDLLGIADIGMLSGISIAIIDSDREKIVKLIAELVDRGTDLKSFAKDLVGFFRDLLVAKIVKKPEDTLELDETGINAIRQILPKVSADILTLMLSEMVKAESEVRSSFSPRLSLEMSLIRVSFISALKPVKEAIENIEALMKGMPQGTNSGVRSQESGVKEQKPEARSQESGVREQISEPETQNLEPIDDISLLNAIMEKIEDPRITSKLEKAKPMLNGDTLTLTFNSNDAIIFADAIKKNSALIEKIASGIRKNPTKIVIEIDAKAKKVVSRKDLEDKARAEPSIKEAMELFEGRIIDVKPKENGGG
ncbi:MAG: DNA polymerase III subunit gamma/tau [Thermodesulfovibrionales bacterium]|nr:DNA polymerase III subunit gamma/tau [Thermodesulfovibrionales bacterium]MDP3112356.1 DNA polymerase III subunit gamma/tau [Thermodesulfovibrionales bacterium]